MTKIKMTLDISKTPVITPALRQRQNDVTAYTADVQITSNSEAFDLTGYKVSFEGVTSKGNKVIDDIGITVTDATKGQFTYAFPKEGLRDVGQYQKAYFSLSNGTKRETSNDFGVFVLASADLTEDETGDYLSEYEKMLEQLRALYASLNIDQIREDMENLQSEMDALSTDVKQQLATAKADIEQQLANAKSEMQSMIDEITKTLADKDVAIRGEDNDFTKNNKFELPIEGSFKTREATFTSFDDVAKDMTKFPGNWYVADKNLTNAPFSSWYTVHIITGTSFTTGTIVANYLGGGTKITAVSDGKIVGWKQLATLDDVKVLNWQPNMPVKKGQLITFKSLGAATTGLLTNPVFMSLVDQNTGTSFPAADSIEGVSGKWKLINPDSYTISYVIDSYALKFNFKRRGNNVSLVTGFSTHDISSGYDFMAAEKLSNLSDVWRPQDNFAWINNATSMLLIWDSGRITLQGNNSAGSGSLWTGMYMAKNGYQWVVGAPAIQ
ncbi:DUF2479 domain-containing protein [Weissella muntiaci]|uniref:DUF2479 domain-containing protein n=1 Tax=Weissella muntiaci TaxID=2508881 RepID=A0A6C2C7G9_9LACO|nr:BppU family phage baseplate upper protein [Weissella muntiaci]TYC49602.1 DUF2479 domain-containing protein [Weissella muntiaci]